jgi:hypothetical protein
MVKIGDDKVNVLRIKKPASAIQNFDDGYEITFPEAKPEHIQFYCMTDSQEKESCDIRLYLREHLKKEDVSLHYDKKPVSKPKEESTTDKEKTKKKSDEKKKTVWYFDSDK